MREPDRARELANLKFVLWEGVGVAEDYRERAVAVVVEFMQVLFYRIKIYARIQSQRCFVSWMRDAQLAVS